MDMTHAICKECHMEIKYSGNTMNMRAYLTCHHQVIALADNSQANIKSAPPKNQPTLDTLSLTKLPSNSERAKKITQSIIYFMCKDLHPYNVVENEGFTRYSVVTFFHRGSCTQALQRSEA